MEKIIKLTSEFTGKAVYFNPKRICFFIETETVVDVCGDEFRIGVTEPWGEIGKIANEFGFIEFVRTDNAKHVLAQASTIAEWHEQGGGVLLEFGCNAVLVQGALEEVAAKIEKALDGERSKG